MYVYIEGERVRQRERGRGGEGRTMYFSIDRTRLTASRLMLMSGVRRAKGYIYVGIWGRLCVGGMLGRAGQGSTTDRWDKKENKKFSRV